MTIVDFTTNRGEPVKEQVRVLLQTASLEDAELAKDRLEELVQASK
ncbi:hypothetical protein [Arthrobacter antibioticus]|nr:hypothetical protein [Arthrobacter sp. H35-MC1]MDJ0316235.1 hypothetical protein [Arthrobacter sp. H35-MC1]